MSEADAREMAQPEPWKPTSFTTPSSTSTCTVILSPQSGLSPRASRLARSGTR
jgi:hypothetical protein